MERLRDSRRTGVSGGGQPPPRRRLRSNGGGGGAGPRDSPRSERRRGERLMLNGSGGGRDDGDETSDESLGDDDEDADEELAASAPRYPAVQRRSPSTAPPPSPPQPSGGHHHSSSSSGGGGGGYHNHHHHGGQQLIRKGGSNPKSPIVWKAADEMIGVPVPRKARSVSTKRSSHEWSAPGGGSGGGSGSGAGDSVHIQRSSSRPISPASASTTGPARKKLKQIVGGGSSGTPGQAQKQRPSPSLAPSPAPPPPPPSKISKSPSFIQEEIEVAEVLFGLTMQFPCHPKPGESNHKLEPRGDASEAKSGNSSPAPSSSAARPSDSTSATIAPKRKRPRLVKYDEDNRPASPAKPELAEPSSSRPEALPTSRSEPKAASLSAATESGTTTATAGAQHEASREPEKKDDHSRSRDSDLRAGESDRRDHRTESRTEPPPPPPTSGKPEGESATVVSEPRNGEATTATKTELASDGPRQEKFCIDLMAPPPGKQSPDRDGVSDAEADKKGLDSGIDKVWRGNSEKKDGERLRRGVEINLEDDKVQRIPAEELAPKKHTLQLDLEKPGLGATYKSPSERRPQQPTLQQQQQKSCKNEPKHEKSGNHNSALLFADLQCPAVTPPMPIPVGSWLGSFPPFGYLGPVPGLSAAGIHHPMDVKPGSSGGLQHAALLPPPPVRPKRCATHCFIAQQIQYNQRITKMNSFWPPAAAAAAAAAAGRSAPLFGPRPFNMGVVPPAEAASILVNPMQGSYPVRAHAPLQESKAPSMATAPFQGSLSKDKATMNNAAVAESSQRKQPSSHEAQQSSPVPNMLQGPAFIFPFNQQHAAAAAVAAANAAKPSGGSNAVPPSATAHTSAANLGAAAMNLSFGNFPTTADAQFLAILQNGGYPFPVAAHAGGPPSYRGMAPPGPGVPFFNGHVYSSHMVHPSQQQGAPPQNLQKASMSSLSTSSQKHQPQQSQGLLGYAPNANAAAAANNSQSYSSGNQRPVLLPGLSHRQDSEKTVQDGTSLDDKSSHPQKGSYDHNYAVPVHLPNFALMPPTSTAGGQSDKKLSDHHLQQLPPASRGQGVRIDLASSQPFLLPFGSVGAPGSAPSGLDFSSLAQTHALFQNQQEAGRHGYPQLNFAAAQSVQAAQHKSQHHQVTGETKSLAGDSTHNTVDSERKKSAAAKYPSDSQQHSLSFSRQENKSYVSPFFSGSTNDGSSRTLSLIGPESSNVFGLGGKSASASAPAATSATALSPTTIPQQQQQQQQQQHFLQLHKQQQLIQYPHLNSRPRSATPSNTGGYSDRMNMANFQGMMYPSSAAQGGAPSQSQLKASSARATGAPAGAASSGAPPSNLIVMKNSGLHQQQAKAPLQSISTTNHQPQSSLNMSSSKMGPITNISTGGGDLSRSSNAPVASGSPSNSVSKSTGGSPPASGSAKGVPPVVQLSSPQQQSAKNPASSSGAKSTPTNHYIMPSILGQQPNVSPASNSGSKQQSHIPSLKQQPFQQGHFFISNAYAPQAPVAAGGVALGFYQKRSADKTQQQVPHQQSAMSAASSNNMKVLHPPPGGFMHSQSPSGVPHSHMSAAQLNFGPVSVKPTSDQKPAAGNALALFYPPTFTSL
ncbi:hypothetical protein GUJ93_ZPchr0007g6247 [Zizania palustris]|uniref:Protein TIME FOR COFFEE n=1 Tax=Zizania palustris TaxID=103762 RepID=A0A8J5VZ43_ZIZPA|nr:hypothetical protein GUJ93_ZPchr0007g6247 [Zizania palustris]